MAGPNCSPCLKTHREIANSLLQPSKKLAGKEAERKTVAETCFCDAQRVASPLCEQGPGNEGTGQDNRGGGGGGPQRLGRRPSCISCHSKSLSSLGLGLSNSVLLLMPEKSKRNRGHPDEESSPFKQRSILLRPWQRSRGSAGIGRTGCDPLQLLFFRPVLGAPIAPSRGRPGWAAGAREHPKH